jgi:VCBS repeat-containing protein
MKLRAALSALTVAALAPIVACGGDDSDATSPSDGNDDTAEVSLDIDYTHPEADVEFAYQIECRDGEGEVTGDIEQAEVDASAACESLTEAAVVARLVDGPDHDVCTEIYGGADVAQITGTIGDQTVDTTVDRTNGCAIDDWDEVLGDLLPPAIGLGPSS